MTGIGAVIRIGAGGNTLVLSGQTWDLQGLDRGKTTALASMLSDAIGITKGAKGRKPRARRDQILPHVGASQTNG